ncbi:phospholipase D-like domain-containing protein [Nanoarchaeota archaeon]
MDRHTIFSFALLIAVFVLGVVVTYFFVPLEWSCPSFGADGDVTTIVNDGYFEQVLEEIENADESIYVVIYNMKAYSSNNSVQQLQDALIDAKKRGVDVKVILDQSKWQGKITSSTINNEKAKEYLEKGGVEVRFDSLKQTTHVKMLVIDGKVVIIGSTNWTFSALERNNEANVMVKDSEVVDYFLDYFNYLWENS